MRQVNLIDSVTAGVTVTGINIVHNQPATLAASGLGTGETATLQIRVNSSYVNVYDGDTAELVQLTSTGNVIAVSTPGTYGLVLTASSSAVSVDRITSGV